MNIIFLIFLLLPAYHAFYYDPYPDEIDNVDPMIRPLERKQVPRTEPLVDIPPNPKMSYYGDWDGFSYIVGDALIQFLRTDSDAAWNSFYSRLVPTFDITGCGVHDISLDRSRNWLHMWYEYFHEITKPQIRMRQHTSTHLWNFELHFESASKWPRHEQRHEWDFWMNYTPWRNGTVGGTFMITKLTMATPCGNFPMTVPVKPSDYIETLRQEIIGAMVALTRRNGGADISAFNKFAWRFAPNAQYDICDGGSFPNAGALFTFMHNTFQPATKMENTYLKYDNNPNLVRYSFKAWYGNEPYETTTVEDWTFTISTVYIYPNSRWPTWGITAVRRACPAHWYSENKKGMGDAKVKETIEQIQNLHRTVGWDPVNAFIDNFDERSSNIQICNEGSKTRSGFKQWLYQEIGKYQSNRVLKGNIASYDPLDFTLLFEFKDNYMTVNREFKFKSRLNQGRYIFEQLIVSCHIRLG